MHYKHRAEIGRQKATSKRMITRTLFYLLDAGIFTSHATGTNPRNSTEQKCNLVGM